MDNVISFTPSQIIAFVVALSGTVVSISAAISVFVKAFEKAKQPERDQNTKIAAIESRLNAIDETIEKYRLSFEEDNSRFNKIEQSNKITQSALLALLKHAINGNDTESLKQAQKDIEAYLIDKQGG